MTYIKVYVVLGVRTDLDSIFRAVAAGRASFGSLDRGSKGRLPCERVRDRGEGAAGGFGLELYYGLFGRALRVGSQEYKIFNIHEDSPEYDSGRLEKNFVVGVVVSSARRSFGVNERGLFTWEFSVGARDRAFIGQQLERGFALFSGSPPTYHVIQDGCSCCAPGGEDY